MKRFLARYGPWSVVTGATLGIGHAFAHEIAARGCNVALVARSEDALQHAARELRARYGVDAIALPFDLSSPGSHEALMENTRDLDVGLLVAAAGYGTSGAFLDIDEAAELEMLEVNCAAILRECRDFGRRFVERGRGGIVLMGSLLGFQGVPRSANYAATKAYVQSLAEGLHDEWKPRGVDVVACAPGPVRSSFERRANMRMKVAASPKSVAASTIAALGTRTTVVPGALSKLMTYSLAPLTRNARTRILGAIMAGMTRHQSPG